MTAIAIICVLMLAGIVAFGVSSVHADRRQAEDQCWLSFALHGHKPNSLRPATAVSGRYRDGEIVLIYRRSDLAGWKDPGVPFCDYDRKLDLAATGALPP